MGPRGWRSALAVVVLLAAAACSGDDDEPGSGPLTTTTRPSSTTTTRPPVWTGEVTRESPVAGRYRQGLARHGDTWIFTTNDAVYRTGPGFAEVQAVIPAISDDLEALGYNHIGDGDVDGDVLWLPLESDGGKDSGEQLTARWDAETLTPIDSFPVAQHHNAFVAVDPDGVVWSADEFSDDTLLRYRVEGTTVEPLEPLVMDRVVERIQGADWAEGAIWLATDDDRNGVYRVDVETGDVTFLASMGHAPAGEGEGIDATELPSGLLHALVADEEIVPMYLVDIRVGTEAG